MRSTAFANLGPGWFSDCALGNGRGWVSGGFAGIGMRILTWTGDDTSTCVEVFREPLIEGIGYSRMCVWDGDTWAAWHDGRVGHLFNLTLYMRTILTPCENSSPICFGFGFVAWQGAAAQSWPVSRMVLSTGAVVDHVRQGVGTGLSRVLADGTVRTIDEDRFALPGATQPCFAGDLAVGEGNPDGALWRLSEKEGVAWPGEETFVPKCAMLGDRVALTTSGGRGGIRLFCGSREELALLQRDHPPDPDPEKPMITDAQMATLKAERAKYPDTVTPEQIGAIINATCWTHRDDPNVPGMQRKDGGTHSIQPRTGFGIWNGIRYRDASGQHWGEDICGGCSVGQFTPVHQTPGTADPATFVPPVEPVDVPPDTGLETRVAALERDVVRLRYECSVTKGLVEALEARVYALESNPGGGLSATDVLRLIAAAFDNHVAVGSTGKSYGHAHSAELPLKTKIEAAIR